MCLLVDLLSETAAGRQSSLAAAWLSHNDIAPLADNNGLRMAEHSSDLEAALAFNVHEKTVWRLH